MTWAVQQLSNHLSNQSGTNGEDMPRLVKLQEKLIYFEMTVELTSNNVNRARDKR